MQLVHQRSRQADSATSSSAITKDLQRMFARKISFSTESLSAACGVDAREAKGGGRGGVTVAMLTAVVKLTLKTLVEEVRLATFGRAGFQQIQVDCSMLRWVLPSCVSDEEDVLALLDEVFISCQERCVDCSPLEQAVIEALCESERQQLLLSLG